MERDVILSVRDLDVKFTLRGRVLHAIRGVSLDVYRGESLAIVGESGSGKSVFTKTFMGLTDQNGYIDAGSILYDGKDLAAYQGEKQWRTIRGGEIAMVLQDPMTSLNPVMTVADQIGESIMIHNPEFNKEQILGRVKEVLNLVGIAENRASDYPHQFSGGMKQRVVIAMALACNPHLIIADEPTTALDVTIQAQVISMMRNLRDTLGTAMIMITHDLGIVAQTCDNVAIMYAGELIEVGTAEDIFCAEKHHPYTVGLFGSIPNLNVKVDRLSPIPGLMPDPTNLPEGCPFAPRCNKCMPICEKQKPGVYQDGEHQIRCHLFNGAAKGGQ